MAKPGQTEKPTEKRKAEARKKGQIARSPDIGSAAVFIAIVVALHVGFNTTLASAAQAIDGRFRANGAASGADDPLRDGAGVRRISCRTSALLLLAFLSAVVIGIVANIAQFGLIFMPQKLAPQLRQAQSDRGFLSVSCSRPRRSCSCSSSWSSSGWLRGSCTRRSTTACRRSMRSPTRRRWRLSRRSKIRHLRHRHPVRRAAADSGLRRLSRGRSAGSSSRS